MRRATHGYLMIDALLTVVMVGAAAAAGFLTLSLAVRQTGRAAGMLELTAAAESALESAVIGVRRAENPAGRPLSPAVETMRVTIGGQPCTITIRKEEQTGCPGLWRWVVEARPPEAVAAQQGSIVSLETATYDPW
jgi:type II secretory pathway pseudopilin PulG